MHARFAAVKTGVVVLAAGLALLALIYFATGGTWFQQWSYYQLVVEPGPLAPWEGDPIYVNGVSKGKVESSWFATRPFLESEAHSPQEDLQTVLMVRARIAADTPLTEGTKGQIKESLTGQRSLHLRLGRTGRRLESAATEANPIRIDQAPDMSSVMATFEQVGTQVNSLVAEVGTLTTDIQVLAKNANATVTAVKARIEGDEISQTLANVRNASEHLSSITQKVDGSIDGITDDLQAAARHIKSLAVAGEEFATGLGGRIDPVVADVLAITGKVKEVVNGAAPKVDAFFDDVGTIGTNLVNLSEELKLAGPEVRETLRAAGRDVDELMEVLKDTGYNLADASEDIRAHPWKLLNEPEAQEIAYENLRTTMQNYVRAMQRVDRAAETVRQAMALDPANPQAESLLRRALASLDGSLDGYNQVEATLLGLLRDNRPTPAGRVVPAAPAGAAPPPRVRPR